MSARHECGLDRTYCDGCGNELEVGQIGRCSDCASPQVAARQPKLTPTERKFKRVMTRLCMYTYRTDGGRLVTNILAEEFDELSRKSGMKLEPVVDDDLAPGLMRVAAAELSHT